MNTQTLAPVDADATRVALDASASLAAVLTRALTAGNAVIVKAYGADTDTTGKRDPRAAVKLAKAVADDFAGAAKGKGMARARVLAVRSLFDTVAPDALLADGQSPTDTMLVTLSRTVLDKFAADAREERKAVAERRASLNSVYNDRTADPDARREAAHAVMAIDSEIQNTKAQAKFDALNRALATAKAAGISRESILSAVEAVYSA